MHFGKQFVKLSHGLVAGEDVLQEFEGVDGPDKQVGIRNGDGRIVVVLPHNGQVHVLGPGDTHLRVHVVQQVHIEEQVSRYGGNQPQRLFLVGRIINARQPQHIAHAIVDGFGRCSQGKGRNSTRHHLAHVPLGKKVAADVIVPVKLFDVDNLRRDGPHLKQVKFPVLQGPLDVFLFPEDGPYLFRGFIQQFDFGPVQQIVLTGTIILARNLITVRRHLSGNQVLPLPFHGFYQDGRPIVGAGGEQHARLVAVNHLLHHDVHSCLAQVEVPCIVLDAACVQRGQTFPDAFHQMVAVHEQAGFILARVGNIGLVFIRGR